MKLTKETKIENLQHLKESYDKIFRKKPIKGEEEHYQWALKVLSPQKGCTLLDIACGGGYFLQEAEKTGTDCYGIDISTVALGIAKKNTRFSKMVCAAGEALPFHDACFDFTANLGSLEHFLDPGKGVQEMVRVMKKNGRSVLLLPNSHFILTIWNVLKKGSTGRETVQQLDRWATKAEWAKILEQNGLKVEKILKYNLKPQGFSLKYRLIRPFIPLNLSYHFLFVCSKK